MAKILLIGADGQLGTDLISALTRDSSQHEIVPLTIGDVDIRDKDETAAIVREESPNTVIKRYDRSTGVATPLTAADGRLDAHGKLSEDGLWLAHAVADSGYSDPWRIYVMGSDGSGVVQVSSNTGLADRRPNFSPDSTS